MAMEAFFQLEKFPEAGCDEAGRGCLAGPVVAGAVIFPRDYFNQKINSFSANEFTSVQEYFSACAHVLVYRLQDIDNVCVYVTSSAAKEGKSSITANIGYALAKLGYKTLLMDMDVRNPSLASKFIYDRDDKHCLNAVYRGEVKISDAIVKINSNLDILPTRLENERLNIDYDMLEIIATAKPDYDFVIIDTAPVGQVSDSMNINQAADCAIFVVRQDQVWIDAVSESVSRLRKSGIALLGAIMNDTKDGSNNYYHSNYKQFADSPYVHYPERSRRRKSKDTSSRNVDSSPSQEAKPEAKTSELPMDIGTLILRNRNKQKEKKAQEEEQLKASNKSEEETVDEVSDEVVVSSSESDSVSDSDEKVKTSSENDEDKDEELEKTENLETTEDSDDSDKSDSEDSKEESEE